MFVSSLHSGVVLSKNYNLNAKNNFICKNKKAFVNFGKVYTEHAKNEDIYCSIEELRQKASEEFHKKQKKFMTQGKISNSNLKIKIEGLKIARDREINILINLGYSNDVIESICQKYNDTISELETQLTE